MPETIYLSEEGLRLLKERIEKTSFDLKKMRDEKALAYTASGDTWHDNPYFNKLEQDERRKAQDLAELETQLATATPYSVTVRNVDRVQLGSIVQFSRYNKKEDTSVKETWEIVGFGETDVEKKQVAYNAPLAKALIGLRVQESIEATTPKGPMEYEILALFPSWEAVKKTS